MDKETEILSRLAANHLFLGQFEPLRAIIVALRARNPDLALAVLQTIVAHSGRFDNILWSPSCPSPSLLTYLSAVELSQFDNASSAWGFDPETLRLRAEFLLLVQSLIDKVSESLQRSFDLESIEIDEELETESSEAESLKKKSESLRDGGGELEGCVRVLDRVLELGVKRLKPREAVVVVVVSGGDENETSSGTGGGDVSIEEGELMCLRSVVFDHYVDVFDALCWNIQRQVRGGEEGDDASGLAITVRREEMPNEEEVKVLRSIQRSVQLAHLEALRECIKNGEVDGAVSRIRFLHLDYGVEETEYRTALQELLKMVSSGMVGYGDSWREMRQNLLKIYSAALASNCGHLVKMIQVLQDDLLLKEIEMYRSLDNNQIPPPLERLQRHIDELKPSTEVYCTTSPFNSVVSFCMRDMYHYARVSGLHLLECVMETSLSAVKNEQLQEASNILLLFPRLQPLVATMGWDLLSGKTAARRKLMQLLWKTKSQVLRLEDSSLYSKQSDEISCVEYLCDSLCHQLDLASFVACVNSGQPWNSKLSLTLSAKDQLVYNGDDAQYDPFVENFVLERLSAQSPLRVLFDVVPGIKFQDAIEMISMQPIASTLEAWKRMQDVELMHMRYALDSAILALGVMGKSMSTESHQAAFCHLKDLQNHLEAVNTTPRKIMMVNIIISLLHMDDQSLNLTHCTAGSYSESHYTCASDQTDQNTCEGGNELVISFTGKLLEILHHSLPSTIPELDHSLSDGINRGGRQAVEWRVSIAKHFIEEWEWRLSILQRLLPLSERQWRWKEALTVLRAAPSKLLNLCMQRAKYDIGEEAVHRFSLSAEDKATLELAEWVDSAVRRQSVEDVVSRAADDGTSTVHDLDFASLRSQLGSLAAILLCIDVAATSAQSAKMSQQLLDQAQVMLSEIYPGVSPKIGSSYWDQILEVGVISVLKRVLKRLHEFLDQDDPPALQATLSGENGISSPKDSTRLGQRERVLDMLHHMIEDAHKGKRQFLSGKLHNLARAVADEESELTFSKGEGSSVDQKVLSEFDKDGVLGLGLKVSKQIPSSSVETSVQPVGYDVKDP